MKLRLFNQAKKGKKGRLGIDIGTRAVKAVALSRGEKNSLKIKNIGFAKIENPSSQESIVKAVKDSIAKADAAAKEAAIAVSGPAVVVRFIELPRMTEAELRNAIVFEAEKYIPFSIGEVNIDHQLLIPRLGNSQMLVLLVAAKKDFINQRLSLISSAGLTASILDVASFASVNAFLEQPDRKKDEIAALIDIGAKVMDINIIDEDILYFTRTIQLGGDDITRILSEALSIDLTEAEEMKRDPKRAVEVRGKIDPVLRNMIDETRLSFSYYENQSGKNIEKAYLTGGGSRTAGFADMFKENLGITVEPWDPFSYIEAEASVDAKLIASVKEQLGVAIGLALR